VQGQQRQNADYAPQDFGDVLCHSTTLHRLQNADMKIVRLLCFAGLACGVLTAHAAPVVVGSKRFTESYILGELVRQTLQNAGVAAEHKQGLGNTGILEQALSSGAVDVYPEYTGTIVRELLKREGNPSLAELNTLLAPRGLRAAVPLGFNNTYALAVRESQAQALGLKTISDLSKLAPNALKLGLSHEFQARADGWPALQKAYALPQQPGAALDHGLAYEAIKAQQVDLIDIYSTDAKVGRYALRVLQDDRNFFPRYDAVLLMRAAVDDKPLQALAGRIDEAAMIALNAQVELDGVSFAEAARGFLARGASKAEAAPSGRQSFMARLLAPDLWRLMGQHLLLVFGSLALALVVGVPLGVWAWQRPHLAAWLLGAVGILQTIPSLAMLAFLIALLGAIGFVPALIALFLYALLPIVRNTHAGLAAVPKGLSLAASALGLTASQSLHLVQLPLARPLMWAGVKTAAIINVGTATMAAFVGAGGLGERIVAGLAVNDNATMLAGALPAAALALAVQWLFDKLERRFATMPSQHSD
jgi:osmoprotectant transport system permease protein